MFDNNRYFTKGINEEIEEATQIALWNLIDLLKLNKEFELDYLQVFELNEIKGNEVLNQEIIHSQEEPFYRRHYLISVNKPVNKKVYVIDDSEESVMMLSEEY